jgi:hypothetical protein
MTLQTQMLWWGCALCILLILLFATRSVAKTVPALQRRYASPLLLICADEARARRHALQNAAWPGDVRFCKERQGADGDDRLCIVVDANLELFPEWDLVARKNAGRGSIVSHGVRRCLRALAVPGTPYPLPRTMGDDLVCPDARLLFGPQCLVNAALSLDELESGSVVGRRIALWLKECELALGVSEDEIAFEPGTSEDGGR